MASHRIPPSQPSTFICWGCQNSKPNSERMRLDEQTPIPICGACWSLMPISERIKHAQAFKDRVKGGLLEECRSMIACAFGNFLQERGFTKPGEN